MDEFASHLEFLAYTVTENEGAYTVEHETKPNFRFRAFSGGLLFSSAWRTSDVAKWETEGFLEFINTLNAKAAVARFYMDDDKDLIIEAWYPEQYEKAAFAHFLSLWERDTYVQLRAHAEQTDRYLG